MSDKKNHAGIIDKKENDKENDTGMVDKKENDKENDTGMVDKKENNKSDDKKSTDRQADYRQAEHIQETMFAYGTEKQQEFTLKDYYALPDEKRVELIDGVFYDMAAPTIAHQLAGFSIGAKIRDYIRQKKGKCISMVSPVDVQLDCDDDTMVQPDVLVVCDRDKLLSRCVYGAPDFIVEILSPSTSRKDSTIKLSKYRTAGVREYWMVDLERKRVVVYEFEKGDSPMIYGMDQEIHVGIFDGECRINFSEVYEEIHFLLTQGDES